MKKIRLESLMFMITAIIILLLTSKCSYLFKINDSGDANFFLIGAKLILSGKKLYIDFYEQKGLLIYLLHIIGLIITPDSFHGIYIIECLAAYGYYVYSYKTINLINSENKTKNMITTLIICSLAYIAPIFGQGDQVEEFALPLISYILYVTVKYKKTNTINKKEYIITGMIQSILLWSKYLCLMIPVLLTIMLITNMIKHKRYDHIKKLISYLTAGNSLITIPVTGYHIITGSFQKMIEIYFITNIFDYNKINTQNPLNQLKLLTTSSPELLWIYAVCITISIIYIIKKYEYHDIIKSILIIHMISQCTLSLTNAWLYYYLPIYIFYPLEYSLLNKIVKPKIQNITKTLTAISLTICYLLNIYSHEPNINKTIKQEIFAQTISNTNTKKQPVLINLNTGDEGYYLTSKILPTDYHYIITNVKHDEAINNKKHEIENNEADYVILALKAKYVNKNKTIIDPNDKNNIITDQYMKNNNYTIIQTASGYDMNNFFKYGSIDVLYKLNLDKTQ